MIKTFSALTLAAGVLATPAIAKISFSLDIEALTAANGTTSLSNSGLLVLVVDTDRDGFDGPTAGNLASGDDQVVATWDLAQVGPGTSDITLLTEGGVTWDSTWQAGDPLALYWFPSLSSGNQSPTADEMYGVFADSVGLASGDEWKLPAEGTLLHSLKLFTASATKLVSFGDFPGSIGRAAFAVNNPPGQAVAATDVSAANQGSNVVVSWEGGTTSTGGNILVRRVVGGSWETLAFPDASSTSYTDLSARPGVSYEYQVFSLNGASAPATASSGEYLAARSLLTAVAARSYVTAQLARSMFAAWDISRSKELGDVSDPSKKLIVQGTGPFYEQFGLTRITDTKLNIVRHIDPTDFFLPNGTVQYAENTDWMTNANALDIDTVQADLSVSRQINQFELNSKDSSHLGDFLPGYTYSASVVSNDASAGSAHIGVYSAEYAGGAPESVNRITSLSTRGYLGEGDANKMFGYFKIEGDVYKDVVIRVEGPGLVRVGLGSEVVNGVPGGSEENTVLPDPRIVLNYHPDPSNFFSNVVEVARNNDWEDQSEANLNPVGYEDVVEAYSSATSLVAVQNLIRDERDQYVEPFEEGAKDSLLFLRLKPGHYTFAILGDTGIAVLKVFEIETTTAL